MSTGPRPDVIIIMTDEERAAPPYEGADVAEWRRNVLTGRAWFDEHAVNFGRHYTGSLACVPSRPTIFTGQYPDVHGVTQTDGLGKMYDDSRLRWLPRGEVPTLGHWFRAAGYDTHYDGKWHISHADLTGDDGQPLATNDDDGSSTSAPWHAYLSCRPARPLRVLGLDRPRAPRRTPRQQRHPARPADRRSGRRMVGGSLRPSSSGDADALQALLAGGELREPARHRAVPDVGEPRYPPREPVAARPAVIARLPHRRRGPGDQARRADRLPHVVSSRHTGSALARRAHRTASTPSSTATSTTGSMPRSTRHSTGSAARSPTAAPTDAVHRSHVRPRRPARLPRRAPSEVVHAVRRGHPRAVLDRPGRGDGHQRPDDRRRPHVARRHRADPARRGGHRRGDDGGSASRIVHRGAPAARSQPDARGRWRRRRHRPTPST